MNLVVYTNKNPNADQVRLIRGFLHMGIEPLVDAKHDYRQYFEKAFTGIPHRLYFTRPYLLTGTVEQCNFDLAGFPDFAVYFTQGSKVSDADWDDITKYLDWKIFFKEIDDTILAKGKQWFNFATKMTATSTVIQPKDDPRVQRIDAQDYCYTVLWRHLSELDAIVYQITKPTVDRPFTLWVKDFSKVGHKRFVTDFYSCKDFGDTYPNFLFLQHVWKTEMKEPEELTQERFDAMRDERAKDFLPTVKDGKVTELPDLEPVVHRISIDELLKAKEEFGKKIY